MTIYHCYNTYLLIMHNTQGVSLLRDVFKFTLHVSCGACHLLVNGIAL